MKNIKAYLNILKLRLNIAQKREAIGNYPIAAYIEPTLFCNLRCPACPTGLQLNLRPAVTIDEELFRSIIDEIGDYLFYLSMYNWGEPLLHKRTPEMVEYAKRKEIDVSFSTNLSLKLTDDYIERLVRSGLDALIVSLDGVTQETYQKYRRRGNFALVRENMMRVKKMKTELGLETPRIIWQFLVFRHNEHEIEKAKLEYKDCGADDIYITGAQMPFAPYNEGFEPSTIPQYNIYHPDHRYQQAGNRQIKNGQACSWLYGYYLMNPNGQVSPCCVVAAEKDDFGKYSTRGDFFKVWNSPRFRQARALFTRGSRQSAGKGQLPEQGQTTVQLEGMGTEVTQSLSDDELICHQCPIPFRQNEMDDYILKITNNVVHSLWRERSIRKKTGYLLAYLLMGIPNWRGLARRSINKLNTGLKTSFGRQPGNKIAQEG